MPETLRKPKLVHPWLPRSVVVPQRPHRQTIRIGYGKIIDKVIEVMPACLMGMLMPRSSETNEVTLTITKATSIQDQLALIVESTVLAETQTISERQETTRQLESVAKAVVVGDTVVLEEVATDTPMDSIQITDTPMATNPTRQVLPRILIQSLHLLIRDLKHKLSNPVSTATHSSSRGVTEVGPGHNQYPILSFTMAMAKGWPAGPISCQPFKLR
jgi:hypothetical protein